MALRAFCCSSVRTKPLNSLKRRAEPTVYSLAEDGTALPSEKAWPWPWPDQGQPDGSCLARTQPLETHHGTRAALHCTVRYRQPRPTGLRRRGPRWGILPNRARARPLRIERTCSHGVHRKVNRASSLRQLQMRSLERILRPPPQQPASPGMDCGGSRLPPAELRL
jgi:hypothetical protein